MSPATLGSSLPSWNDGATKQAILNFVADVTQEGSPHFVPPVDRIATFDNDGTLWVEQPMYTQLSFALDRAKAMAPMHAEWKDTQPFKAALEGDMKTLAETGEHGLFALLMATHPGMTAIEFQKIVVDWITTARDPHFKRPYTELAYQPMLELLAFLRANGFKTFIIPVAALSSCAHGRKGYMVCRQSKSSALRSRQSSKCATACQSFSACRRYISLTTTLASLSASITTSGADLLPRSEIRTVTSKCYSGQRWLTVAALA
jgi:hypothetical protein